MTSLELETRRGSELPVLASVAAEAMLPVFQPDGQMARTSIAALLETVSALAALAYSRFRGPAGGNVMSIGPLSALADIEVDEGADLVRYSQYDAVDGIGSGWLFRVKDGSVTVLDHVDRTGAVWRPPYDHPLEIAQMGVMFDGGTGLAGSPFGTDNQAALQKMMDAAATGLWGHLIFRAPNGRAVVNFSGELKCRSTLLTNLRIEFIGVELVCTAATPSTNKQYFAVVNTARTGGTLRIEHLNVGMGRACGRVSNTDMVRVGGFDVYKIIHPTIPCSDNMGLTVGREDPADHAASEIDIRGMHIGGRYFAAQHYNGSIGDTGLYVVRGARKMHVDGYVESTGDDGVCISDVPVPGTGLLDIDVQMKDVNGGGKISVTRAQGRIHTRRTAYGGLNLWLLNAAATLDRIQLDVNIEEAGQLEQGDIGSIAPLTRANNAGIYIFGGGKGIKLTGRVSRPRGPALWVQPAYGQSFREMDVDLAVDNVGVGAVDHATGDMPDGTAMNANAQVYHRGTVANDDVLHDSHFRFRLASVACPLISSYPNGNDANDDDYNLAFEFNGQLPTLNAVYNPNTGNAVGALCDFGAAGSGHHRNISIISNCGEAAQSTGAATTGYTNFLRVTGGNDITQFDVTHRRQTARLVLTAAGSWTLPRGHKIVSISVMETAGHSITGGLKIGTAAGGTDVVAAFPVAFGSINTIPDAQILDRLFSRTADQALYLDAVTGWNSASAIIRIEHVREVSS